MEQEYRVYSVLDIYPVGNVHREWLIARTMVRCPHQAREQQKRRTLIAGNITSDSIYRTCIKYDLTPAGDVVHALQIIDYYKIEWLTPFYNGLPQFALIPYAILQNNILRGVKVLFNPENFISHFSDRADCGEPANIAPYIGDICNDLSRQSAPPHTGT